ncbi:Altered inheritance of mitochondria protein 24 mitochondrial [Spathaspora sp. JA1]|nr:Altered inheritance of mitochondria protein 24 mitochondrial [Spathaspora sp. JA1]
MKFLKQIFTRKVISKPLVTGNGPFIDLPKFTPIGNSLLNISLPKHSTLNIRHHDDSSSSSLLAINGDIHDIVSTNTDQYQQLKANNPVSLVINSNSYSIIDTKEDWIILNDANLIAYTGYNFNITPISILNKFNSVKTKGNGTLVLNDNLFNLELSSSEEILINPNALVATTSEIKYKILEKSNSSKKSWSLPKYGIFGSILNNRFFDKINQYRTDITSKLTANNLTVYTRPVILGIKKLIDWIQLYASTIIKRKPIYIKIKGPGKLLINNNPGVSNSQVFTRSEIKTIYNKY